MNSWDRFSRTIEQWAGSPTAFLLAFISIFIWAVTGPFFDWSDTWQITINTGTTIVTFLMVFVIQSAQTRDTRALQLKLDELVRIAPQARNELIGIEDKAIKDDIV